MSKRTGDRQRRTESQTKNKMKLAGREMRAQEGYREGPAIGMHLRERDPAPGTQPWVEAKERRNRKQQRS